MESRPPDETDIRGDDRLAREEPRPIAGIIDTHVDWFEAPTRPASQLPELILLPIGS